MSMVKPLVAGNWKMHGLGESRTALAAIMAQAKGHLAACDVVVCPPFTLVERFGADAAGTGIGIGGQDCHVETKGAFTGDVAAVMLADAGAGWVIVGHSERRAMHAETDALVAAKATAAQAAGLTAIVCVGETEAERDAGQTLAVVGRQLAGSVPERAGLDRLVIAYEPVWAIGTGRTPTDAEIGEVHGLLRRLLVERFGDGGRGVRLLYGGSVKAANAVAIAAIADVNGALVGGASLAAADFLPIVEAFAAQG